MYPCKTIALSIVLGSSGTWRVGGGTSSPPVTGGPIHPRGGLTLCDLCKGWVPEEQQLSSNTILRLFGGVGAAEILSLAGGRHTSARWSRRKRHREYSGM